MIDENVFENIIKATYNLPNLPSNNEYVEEDLEVEEQELFMCSNCNEFVPEDYGKHTEHDGFLCWDCINNGFGQ